MRIKKWDLLLATLFFASGIVNLVRAQAIDHYFTVNPIRVCDDNGLNCATVNMFSPETTAIYTQAGVRPIFLPTTQINRTASQVVASVADVRIANNGQSSNSTVINTWFVNRMTSTSGTLYGEAFVGGNGVAINTTAVNSFNSGVGRVDTVAHEIGHNLGLGHTDFGAGGATNLMTAGGIRNIPNGVGNIAPNGANLDQLTAQQITQILGSPFVKQIPSLVVDTRGSTPFDTNDFFRVDWQSGSTSTYLHSLTLNLAPANAFFDPTSNPPGLDSSPFLLSNLSGLSASDISISGGTDGSQALTLTFSNDAFNPGDSFNFGIDVDLFSCVDCFGALPSELKNARFSFVFSDGFEVTTALGADLMADSSDPFALFGGTVSSAGGPILPPGVLGPPDPVPEPSTVSLMAVMIAGLMVIGIPRSQRAAIQ